MTKANTKRSKTGLLPCPFCGCVKLTMVSLPKRGKKPSFRLLQCDDCGATGPLRKILLKSRCESSGRCGQRRYERQEEVTMITEGLEQTTQWIHDAIKVGRELRRLEASLFFYRAGFWALLILLLVFVAGAVVESLS
jgi:hypothetical protein